MMNGCACLCTQRRIRGKHGGECSVIRKTVPTGKNKVGGKTEKRLWGGGQRKDNNFPNVH